MAENNTVAHAHESHQAFNQRLEQRLTPKPQDTNGPWLSNDVVTRLPRLRRTFDLNRDPHIRQQIQDNEKPESERRREPQVGQGERGSTMVKQDKPVPVPHPPSPLRDEVDRQAFQGRWLAEQRDAVMARAAKPEPTPSLQRDHSRASQVPSR